MYDILIVEDEAPIANLIRMSLTQAGYRCTIASDGDEGADWVERRRYAQPSSTREPIRVTAC